MLISSFVFFLVLNTEKSSRPDTLLKVFILSYLIQGFLGQHESAVTNRYAIGLSVFTARCYAMHPRYLPWACVRVCLSVTSRCSTKTAKRRITQTTPHDTTGTLVFWCQRSPRNSTGVIPYEGAECRWGGQNWSLSTNNRLYLENGTR